MRPLIDMLKERHPELNPNLRAECAPNQKGRTMSANPTNIHSLPHALDALVDQLIEAKRDEDAASKKRVEIEERILALAPAAEEGATTTPLANGMKLTTTGKLSYKADDIEALRNVCAKWDASLVPLKTKTELDETGCKYLRRERPELWAQIARVVTIKPAKTAITVKV